jgi:hypothetical protein
VPGLEPRVTAEIANDDYRLQAEGFITGFQEELVDLVAHREMLLKGARAKIEAGQFDKVGEMLQELERLPTGKIFLMKLAEEKKRLATKDPVVQQKIDKLFADTQQLIVKHLNEKGAEELAQDLRDAKKGGERGEGRGER